MIKEVMKNTETIIPTQGYNKAYICRSCYEKYLKYIKEVNTNDNRRSR